MSTIEVSIEIQVRVPNGNFKKSFSRRKHTSLRSEFTGFAISDGLRPERLLSQPMLLGDMEMRKTFVRLTALYLCSVWFA